MIVEVTVIDGDVYELYMARIPDVIAHCGGTYVVRSSTVTPVTGGWAPDRIIVVAFADLASLRTCFGSPEYRALAPLREAATRTRSVVVES